MIRANVGILGRSGGGGFSPIPEYITALNAFPVTPSNQDQVIQNAWMKKMVDGGYYAKARMLKLHAINAYQNGLVNLKNPGTYDSTLVGSPAFSQYEGFTGNRTSNYGINLRYNPSSDTGISKDNFCYIIGVGDNNDPTLDLYEFGGIDTARIAISAINVNNQTRYSINDATISNQTRYSGKQHIGVSRGNSGNFISQCNLVKESETAASTSLPNVNLHACGVYFNGNFYASSRQIRYVFCFESLTEIEMDQVIQITEDYLRSYDKGLIAYNARYTSDNIVSMRENKVLAHSGTSIKLSLDNGNTYPYSNTIPEIDNDVEFGRIFDNGNILFATNKKMYFSSDNLQTISEKSIIDKDGSTFVPKNTGNNFRLALNSQGNEVTIGGINIFVWGNYGNVAEGLQESNIFYTIDQGVTVKVAYKFGQNQYYGGYGDVSNAVKIRHIHTITYCQFDNSFWVNTGDFQRTEFAENKWLKGFYNTENDTWSFTVEKEGAETTIAKIIGMYFDQSDNKCYLTTDVTGDTSKNGLYRVLYEDILTESAYDKYAAFTNNPSSFIFDNNKLYLGSDTPSYTLFLSTDKGVNLSKEILKLTEADGFYGHMEGPTSDGYVAMRIMNKSTYVMNLGTVFIKIL